MAADTVHTSISRAVAGLSAERARLDAAITTLEQSVRDLATLQRRLALEKVPGAALARAGRGRPARKRPNWSPAARRAAAQRMRALWAARRKGKGAAAQPAKKA